MNPSNINNQQNFSKEELIAIIEKLNQEKAVAIKNQLYEHAANLRDQERVFRDLLGSMLKLENEK